MQEIKEDTYDIEIDQNSFTIDHTKPNAYLPQELIYLHLPYKEPKDSLGKSAFEYKKEFKNTNKEFSLSIKSGVCLKNNSNYVYGIPYGAYAKIIMLYVFKEIKRTKINIVNFGNTYTEIFKNLGLLKNKKKPSSKQIELFKEQFDRLFNGYIELYYNHKYKGKDGDIRTRSGTQKIFFATYTQKDTSKSKNKNTFQVEISDTLSKYIINDSIMPYNYNIITRYSNDIVLADLYLFINHYAYACYTKNIDISIPYKQLYYVLGSNDEIKNFKRNIKKSIIKLCKDYPNFIIRLEKDFAILCKETMSTIIPELSQ